MTGWLLLGIPAALLVLIAVALAAAHVWLWERDGRGWE